jgi:hypothetical protein
MSVLLTAIASECFQSLEFLSHIFQSIKGVVEVAASTDLFETSSGFSQGGGGQIERSAFYRVGFPHDQIGLAVGNGAVDDGYLFAHVGYIPVEDIVQKFLVAVEFVKGLIPVQGRAVGNRSPVQIVLRFRYRYGKPLLVPAAVLGRPWVFAASSLITDVSAGCWI